MEEFAVVSLPVRITNRTVGDCGMTRTTCRVDVYVRDKDGQECDAVIHLRNGTYGLIEIKLGGDKLIEEGVKSLKSMEAKIDTDKMKAPSFLMVLSFVISAVAEVIRKSMGIFPKIKF